MVISMTTNCVNIGSVWDEKIQLHSVKYDMEQETYSPCTSHIHCLPINYKVATLAHKVQRLGVNGKWAYLLPSVSNYDVGRPPIWPCNHWCTITKLVKHKTCRLLLLDKFHAVHWLAGRDVVEYHCTLHTGYVHRMQTDCQHVQCRETAADSDTRAKMANPNPN